MQRPKVSKVLGELILAIHNEQILEGGLINLCVDLILK